MSSTKFMFYFHQFWQIWKVNSDWSCVQVVSHDRPLPNLNDVNQLVNELQLIWNNFQVKLNVVSTKFFFYFYELEQFWNANSERLQAVSDEDQSSIHRSPTLPVLSNPAASWDRVGKQRETQVAPRKIPTTKRKEKNRHKNKEELDGHGKPRDNLQHGNIQKKKNNKNKKIYNPLLLLRSTFFFFFVFFSFVSTVIYR